MEQQQKINALLKIGKPAMEHWDAVEKARKKKVKFSTHSYLGESFELLPRVGYVYATGKYIVVEWLFWGITIEFLNH